MPVQHPKLELVSIPVATGNNRVGRGQRLILRVLGSRANSGREVTTLSEKTPRVPISTGEGQTAYKRQLAYDQLGIDPKDVPITPLVAAQMTRIGRLTGYKRALELLARSEDPEARKVYAVYQSVSRTYRKLVSPEAYCFAAGVDPNRMLEAITVVAVQQGTQSATIVAAIMGPTVVMKTIEAALQPGGFRERRMLLRATGFLGSV